MKKPRPTKEEIAKLKHEILARLDDPERDWVEECQDKYDIANDVREEVLKAAGHEPDDEGFDDLYEALEIKWMPGHYEFD